MVKNQKEKRKKSSEFPVFQLLLIVSCSVTGQNWEKPGYALFTHSHQVFIYTLILFPAHYPTETHTPTPTPAWAILFPGIKAKQPWFPGSSFFPMHICVQEWNKYSLYLN